MMAYDKQLKDYLESLTKISIGFQSAIIYLPNTLAEAPECFKHRVYQYLSKLPQNIRIFGNVILQRCTTRKQFFRERYEDLDPHANSYEFSPHFQISNK